MRGRATIVMALLAQLGSGACTDDPATTEVAVTNGGNGSIDAVLSDGDTEVVFAAVAAGTTSAYREVHFRSLTGVSVSVGAETSEVDLFEATRNVVQVGEDGKVLRVVKPVRASTSASGGW